MSLCHVCKDEININCPHLFQRLMHGLVFSLFLFANVPAAASLSAQAHIAPCPSSLASHGTSSCGWQWRDTDGCEAGADTELITKEDMEHSMGMLASFDLDYWTDCCHELFAWWINWIFWKKTYQILSPFEKKPIPAMNLDTHMSRFIGRIVLFLGWRV